MHKNVCVSREKRVPSLLRWVFAALDTKNSEANFRTNATLLWRFTRFAQLRPLAVNDKLRPAALTCNALCYLMESRSQTLRVLIMTNAFDSRGLETVIYELVWGWAL